MSAVLRVVLIITALLTNIFVIRRIRKANLQIEHAVFWVVFAFLLILMAIFPGICITAARILRIASPANFVFAFFIFILLIREFSQTIHISNLETKIAELTQNIAIFESEEKEKEESDGR